MVINTLKIFEAELIGNFKRSIQIAGTFNNEYEGKIHLPENERPDVQELADILGFLQRESGIIDRPRLTISNYIDALVGYRGTTSYTAECEAGTMSGELTCDFGSDLGNSRGLYRAFVNTMIVTMPATLIPLFIAAFAAYAFSWLDFPGRQCALLRKCRICQITSF